MPNRPSSTTPIGSKKAEITKRSSSANPRIPPSRRISDPSKFSKRTVERRYKAAKEYVENNLGSEYRIIKPENKNKSSLNQNECLELMITSNMSFNAYRKLVAKKVGKFFMLFKTNS